MKKKIDVFWLFTSLCVLIMLFFFFDFDTKDYPNDGFLKYVILAISVILGQLTFLKAINYFDKK